MSVVHIGLAGCGSVSQRGLLPHLSQKDIRHLCELTAVMDPLPGRAEATAKKFGVPMSFDDYDEMLASDIDAVAIASPISIHYEQAMKAIAAGKHLHLNKTMTTTKAEADEVIEAAHKAGVKVVASPGRAHRPVTKRVKKIIELGEIGRVYWAEIGTAIKGHEFEDFRQTDDILSNVNPAWYYKQPSGGPMYDMGAYALHAITGILGPVKRVTGMSGIGLKERFFKDQRIEVKMDDNTHLLLDFGDSIFCLVFCSNSSTDSARTFSMPFISGSEGSILVNYSGWHLPITIKVSGKNIGSRSRVESPGQDLPFVYGAHLKLPEHHVYSDIMHMVDCVLHDKEPAISAEHARHVIEVIELGYKAAETGQTQDVTTTFTLRELRVSA